MNDQERNELRLKVAELCGWKRCDYDTSLTWMKGLRVGAHMTDLPDYPNDLNACHEFENALKPIQRFEYANALETVLDLIPEGQGLGLREHRNFAYAHATAEQRCRAFVATMEKGEHHGR